MAGMHAYLPPSGAGSWVHCHMWPTMNRLYPQDETPESMEGTAAHWCFVQLFWNQPLTLASVADNGIPVTQEMIDGAQMYVRTIDADLAARGLDRSVLQVEQGLTIPSVHEANWGTPDTRFGWANSGIWIYDYKFGHKFVDAYQNWQCIDYALGVADELHLNGLDDQNTPVHITVVQPRNHDGIGPVRRWSGMMSDLRPAANQLRHSAGCAVAALMPGAPPPTATPGGHCYECPGRHACQPLQRSGYKGVWLSGQSVPLELSDDALGSELKLLREAAEILKHRIGGLESDAVQRMTRQGRRIKYFMMEQSLGREGYARPDTEIIAMGQLFGVQAFKQVLLTPKQLVAAGMPSEVVAPLVKQESKGLKLVEDDGKKAAKAFGGK